MTEVTRSRRVIGYLIENGKEVRSSSTKGMSDRVFFCLWNYIPHSGYAGY